MNLITIPMNSDLADIKKEVIGKISLTQQIEKNNGEKMIALINELKKNRLMVLFMSDRAERERRQGRDDGYDEREGIIGKAENRVKEVEEEIEGIIGQGEKLYTSLLQEVEDLFVLLDSALGGEDHIILDRRQSQLRTKLMYSKSDDKVFKIHKRLILTEYTSIGAPNSRGNRIATRGKYTAYINREGKEIIGIYEKCFRQDEHVLWFNNRSCGGAPHSLYTHDGTLIANHLEYLTGRESEDPKGNVYTLSGGNRGRGIGYIPSELPTTKHHKGLDGSPLVFNILE